MNNSTLVESYFDSLKQSTTGYKGTVLETGFTALNTIADLLANQAKPLDPDQCQAVSQLLKEVNMLTFLAYEQTLKH